MGKHSKIGSAGFSLFIFPLKERRPLIWENTLKLGRPASLCLYVSL